MIARRSQSMMFATLMAFVAMLGMAALSGWHSASYHVDEPSHVVASLDVHEADAHPDHPDHDDGDDVVHVAAHAIGSAIAMPAGTLAPSPVVSFAIAWPTADKLSRDGLDPTSLLRPPRA